MPTFKQQPFLMLSALAATALACPAMGNFIDGGLEWLTVTDSIDYSFEQMQAELLPGGTFDGYRHATLDEAWALAANFGYDPGLTALENASAVQDLHNALGTTFASSAGTLQFSTLGYLDDGTRFDIVLQLPVPDEAATYLGEAYQTDLGFLPPASNLIGHYLVRPIPEPAMVASLLGILILLTVYLHRRKPQ
ncbi:MAG: hypothetical protein AB3N33_10100 [Puniceicoccaceae bacterium]